MRACRAIVCAALLLGSACAPDLREDFPFDGDLPDGVYVTHEDLGGGVTRTTVDASHKEAWVYFDFDTLQRIAAPQAAGTSDWDLAFQRFKIISNSGVSGTGSVAVAKLQETDFEVLGVQPGNGYATDEPDGPDDNAEVDNAFLAGDAWYAYDLLTHKVLPRERLVFAVRTSTGRVLALRMVAYYDAAGSGARPTFDWKWLSP
jgi:hypothetical protein